MLRKTTEQESAALHALVHLAESPPLSPPQRPQKSLPLLSMDLSAYEVGSTLERAFAPVPDDIATWGLKADWQRSKAEHSGLEIPLKHNSGVVKADPPAGVTFHATSALVHAHRRLQYQLLHCMRTAQYAPTSETERPAYFIISAPEKGSVVSTGSIPVPEIVLSASPAVAFQIWAARVTPARGTSHALILVEARFWSRAQDEDVRPDDPKRPSYWAVKDVSSRVSLRYLHYVTFCLASSSSASS